MRRQNKRFAKPRLGSPARPSASLRRLRLECLEDRAVLSGVVNIEIAPLLSSGFLSLIGDGSNNQVEIRQTTNPHEYFISSPDDTLFQINGAGVTVNDATVNGITNDIDIDLGDGVDEFSFLGVSPGVVSQVPSSLHIENGNGSDTNLLQDVVVNGNFIVNHSGTGYSELHIVDSTVVGDTTISNGGGPGDSHTVIDHSNLQAGGPSQYALQLFNPSGSNILEVIGQSQLGSGSFIVTGHPIVDIANGDGGSRTTFTGAGQVAGIGTTTVYGGVRIQNGNNVPGTLDIVTFNSVNVLGAVQVNNANGDTESVVAGTTLGSHLIPGPGGTGGPVVIQNSQGYDSFTMSDSTIPYGLRIENDFPSGSDNWGSTTDISTSSIGTHPFGPQLSGNDALEILGDNGMDAIRVATTILGGTFDLSALHNGSNSVLIENNSSMAALYLVGGDGGETVTIDNSTISVSVMIQLNDGADTLRLLNEDLATQWPSPLLGIIDIDGGGGIDTTNTDALLAGALGFEMIVP